MKSWSGTAQGKRHKQFLQPRDLPPFVLPDSVGTLSFMCEKSQPLPVQLLDLPEASQEAPSSWHQRLVLPHHRVCHRTSSPSFRWQMFPEPWPPSWGLPGVAQFVEGVPGEQQSWCQEVVEE